MRKIWLVLTALACLSACASETKVELVPTQVLLRIHSPDPALLSAMETLRVQLYVRQGNEWDPRSKLDLPRQELQWPVDLPVLPPPTDSTVQFEVVADVLAADGTPLAQTRTVTRFVPGERKLLEVWIFQCPGRAVCAEENCRGAECTVCTSAGECRPVGMTDQDKLPDLEPEPDAGPTLPESVDGGDGGDVIEPVICEELRQGENRCELLEGCAPLCQNGGQCLADPASPACDCSAVDYEGERCEQKIDDCASTPCEHGGRCVDGMRSYSCDCAETGYAGETCADPVNECAGVNVCSTLYPCLDRTPFYNCRGQFPEWNVSQQSRFTVSNGIVRDTRTGLEWKQAFEPDTYTWENAKARCTDGFRLPTRTELLSIVDISRRVAIDELIFPGTKGAFWTSSPLAGSSIYAWRVDFLDGHAEYQGRTVVSRVRCVR